MVAADVLDDNAGQTEWLQRLLIGSVACVACIVFLGLKFKWFRAQLNFGEPKSPKSSEPVQGIGFKFKTNADDFQSYRVVSEFAQPPVTIPTTQQYGGTHQSKISKSLSYSEQNLSSKDKNIDATNLTAKPLQTVHKNTAKSKSTQDLAAKVSPEVQQTTKEKRRVRIQESPDKNQREEPVAQVTNPMFETCNSSMKPAAKAVVTEEKPKNRDKFEEDTTEEDLYFMSDNSMYSSQAASIFFGGRSHAEEPLSVRNNGFRRDSDNESVGSATSA